MPPKPLTPAGAHALSHWLPQRLGTQLYLVAAASLWVSITLFGFHAIREQSSMALASIEQQARSMARDLALLSEPLLVADKLDDLEVLLRNTMELPEILEVRVLDSKGQPVSHLLRAAGEPPHAVFGAEDLPQELPPALAPLLVREDTQQRVVAWQPVVSGTVLGWIRVDHSTEALVALRQRIWTSTALACLLAGLLSIGMMRALLRRPLTALNAAQSFAADLERIEGQQLSRIEGPLETRSLALALNQASTRLYEQRHTIEASVLRLQQQEAALASINEQLRTIFALSPDAFLSIDNAGKASFANAAFFQLTGLSAEAVIGQSWEQVDKALCSQAQDPSAAPPLARLMSAPESEPVHLVLAQPRMTVLELLARVGQTASVSRLIYMRDITRESEIDRMKTEFLSTAAHELRTPMTSIFGCVELMLARELSPSRQKDLLGIINRQSRTMIAVVNELLDIARLEARGGSDFCFENLPLAEAVQRAVADFVPPDGRTVPCVGTPDCAVEVHVDPSKLGQVVSNLLSNAYKYSSSGTVSLRYLPVQQTAEGARVGFEVEDQGIGMTAEQLARVTERFYRADTSGHVLGTGLGMSIVDNIVKQLGGSLELRSEPGLGTTVSIWLPARLHSAQDTQPSQAANPSHPAHTVNHEVEHST